MLSRHLDLTDEEKEKLDGSYKVAKKLEKLQSKGHGQQQLNSLGDDANDGNESPTAEGESRSLDSQGSSEKTSPETSLIGSNGTRCGFRVAACFSVCFFIRMSVVSCGINTLFES